MYADDTELHFSDSDLSVVENTLQTDAVSKWLVVNRLKLNVLKPLCIYAHWFSSES